MSVSTSAAGSRRDERQRHLPRGLAPVGGHYFRAPSGKHGQGQNKHGRSGQDLILEVPVGTVVKDIDTNEIIADLTRSGEQWLAASGGRGGKGNARFVTSTVRVPRIAEEGHEGEHKELILELKLIADVGLVGFPNAGKSTLIAAVSAARPKIADYPFTTLVPNLGVVQYADSPPFVVADIPGLIEGAHQGAGLGTRFLRHIERTRILLHVIDVSQVPPDDPLRPFKQIENELDRYSDEISQKRRVIALNKIDLMQDPETIEKLANAYRQTNYPVVMISALQQAGLQDLLRLLLKMLTVTQ